MRNNAVGGRIYLSDFIICRCIQSMIYRKRERERNVESGIVRYGYTDVLLYREAERPKQYMASCSDMRTISSMRCLQMLTCQLRSPHMAGDAML